MIFYFPVSVLHGIQCNSSGRGSVPSVHLQNHQQFKQETMKIRYFIIVSSLVTIECTINLETFDDELNTIFNNFKDSFTSDETREIFNNAVLSSEQRETSRSKRDMPTMYMNKKKKLRTCANMNGILGGSNAFNTISFILAILTLVVNVNNNINNNNNNLNQANINTASNNNANANSNNNNANVINVMPPGKKKRRKRSPATPTPHPFDVYEDRICAKTEKSSLSGEVSLAAMILVQKYFQSQQQRDHECQHRLLCDSLQEVKSLGLGGRMLEVGVRTLMAGSEDLHCEELNSETQCNNQDHETDQRIQCSQCGHQVSSGSEIFNKDSSSAASTALMNMFGRDNVTVHEFINPAQIHSRSINVREARCEAGNDTWMGGDTWYRGHEWRVCRCPVCGQALGWQWRRKNEVVQNYDWVDLRLGKVSNFNNFLFGPLLNIPNLIKAFG